MTVPTTAQPQANKVLEDGDLSSLLSDKQKASRNAEPLLVSGSTRDMIDGINLFTQQLRHSYVDLVRKTRGEVAFQGFGPIDWAEHQIEPAARAAQLTYEKRYATGLDGSAGRLDAPEARFNRLNELIEEEVRKHTASADFQKWLPRWKAL